VLLKFICLIAFVQCKLIRGLPPSSSNDWHASLCWNLDRIFAECTFRDTEVEVTDVDSLARVEGCSIIQARLVITLYGACKFVVAGIESIQLWNLFSRPWKSIEFGQKLHKVSKKYRYWKYWKLLKVLNCRYWKYWKLLKVLNCEIGFQDPEKVLNLVKSYIKYLWIHKESMDYR